MNEKEAFLVTASLNYEELQAFRMECDSFKITSPLSATSCALDFFENVQLKDDDEARTDEQAYFKQRWINNPPCEGNQLIIRNILLAY